MTMLRVRTVGVRGAALVALLLTGLVLWKLPLAPPEFAAVRAHYTPSEADLLDRHGVIIDSLRVNLGVRRFAWVPLSDVSPALVRSVVTGEDRRFWSHHGVDWIAVIGAARAQFSGHARRGASTLSMQVASLLQSSRPVPRGGRSWQQKIQQVRLAYGLEQRWSKSQILEAYLNLLQYRGELQGIGATSRLLARKLPAGLTEAESDVLAALLPAPAASAPAVAARACARLQVAEARTVNCQQLRQTAERLLSASDAALPVVHLAPQLATSLLKHAGESLRTTLDAELQRRAIEALAHQLSGLEARNVRDGAALVVDNASGEVLAYVASGGPASRASFNDGVRAPRQAGSTLKPFLYGLALERRYLTAASLLDDSPVNLETEGGVYLPQDYDHQYKGPVSVRTALGGSLNVPAVRTLMLVGVEPFRDRLQQLGYAGIDRDGDYYGYSLALGSAEVTLWQQAQAYRTLALGGRLSPLRLRAGDDAPVVTAILPAGATFIVSDMLADRVARAGTFGLDSSLATGYWSAVKTGTSKDMRDNWCIGYTARYTVAVWVGNFEGDPMHDVSGVTGAAPVWRELMDAVQSEGGSAAPAAPADVRRAPVRFVSAVEGSRSEWFLAGTELHGAVRRMDEGAGAPRIESPTNGMIVAIDPDIPAERQRMPVRVKGGGAELAVQLDETVLGTANHLLWWEPRPGTHTMAVKDASGRVIAQSLFTVR